MRTILILGATSDIAQAVARHFAKAKWQLLLGGRSMAELAPIASDLHIRYDTPVKTLRFDALDFNSHETLYTTLPEKPSVVLWACGYLGDENLSYSDFREIKKTIDTNYTGAVSILTIVARDFEKRGGGTIIALSSVAGDRGRARTFIYGSAKAGLTAYLSALRSRLTKSGVHVMTVKPGYVATKMTRGKSFPKILTATPERVARDIVRAYQKKKDVLYTPARWRYIMWIIRLIPEVVFKKLTR